MYSLREFPLCQESEATFFGATRKNGLTRLALTPSVWRRPALFSVQSWALKGWNPSVLPFFWPELVQSGEGLPWNASKSGKRQHSLRFLQRRN